MRNIGALIDDNDERGSVKLFELDCKSVLSWLFPELDAPKTLSRALMALDGQSEGCSIRRASSASRKIVWIREDCQNLARKARAREIRELLKYGTGAFCRFLK